MCNIFKYFWKWEGMSNLRLSDMTLICQQWGLVHIAQTDGNMSTLLKCILTTSATEGEPVTDAKGKKEIN